MRVCAIFSLSKFKDRDLTSSLIYCLNDEDIHVRCEAICHLAHRNQFDLHKSLKAIMTLYDDKEYEVRETLIWALKHFHMSLAINTKKHLKKLINHKDKRTRQLADIVLQRLY